MRLVPRKWADFQHYTDRRPPWIKLHRRLLDDVEVARLPVEARAIVWMLWLLASESDPDDPHIEGTMPDLAMRLRLPEAEVSVGVQALVAKGFFTDASNVLASASSAQATATRSVSVSGAASPSVSEGGSEGVKHVNGAVSPSRPAPQHLPGLEPEPKPPKIRVSWDVPCPDDIRPESWAQFLMTRKSKRLAPPTPLSMAKLRRDAAEAGIHVNTAVERCVERGHGAYYHDSGSNRR